MLGKLNRSKFSEVNNLLPNLNAQAESTKFSTKKLKEKFVILPPNFQYNSTFFQCFRLNFFFADFSFKQKFVLKCSLFIVIKYFSIFFFAI